VALTVRADIWRWLVPLAVGAAVQVVPHGGHDPRGWGLLAVFAATIAGLIARPLPAGAVVMVAVTAANLLGLLTVGQALSGFGNSTVWLIVAAFIFARGFVQTRLGERIAYLIISAVGRSALRLGYALLAADLVMAPVTASNTARAGGVLFPVTRSIARAFDSNPGPTASRLGTFLMAALYQGDLIVAGMFLTSMAANPLVAEMAFQGSGARLTWGTWALAAIVPGLVALAVVPYVVYRLCPPEVTDTTEVRTHARERLRDLGPMSRSEKGMLGVFLVVLSLWVTTAWHGISTTTVAYLGISGLLVLRVIGWQDVLEETGAWNALVWFGGLVMLAGQLNETGLIGVFAERSGSLVEGLPWPLALSALLVIYLYSHYAFASMTAHVTAMFPAFFALACALGAPPLLAAVSLGIFSNLNGCLTHYGAGPAPVIYGAGYVSQGRWWKVGFVVSVLHCLIWLPLGFAWWKLIGLW
jgi:DASS family divalent anion:Na+ symporter